MTAKPEDAARQLRSIRRGDGFDRIGVGLAASGYCEPSLPAAVREEFLRPDRLWEPRGEMMKDGSRTTVTELEVEGVPYVFKQYKCVSLRRRLRYALMRTRSIQSWEQGQLLAALGFRVARPLAILVERRFGIPRRSALLMESSRGVSLKELADQDDLARLREARPHLQEFFQRMAAHHLVHGDLSGSNIILDEDNRPTLIDLDGSLLIRSESRFRRAEAEDRVAFMKNWRGHPELAELFEDLRDGAS